MKQVLVAFDVADEQATDPDDLAGAVRVRLADEAGYLSGEGDRDGWPVEPLPDSLTVRVAPDGTRQYLAALVDVDGGENAPPEVATAAQAAMASNRAEVVGALEFVLDLLGREEVRYVIRGQFTPPADDAPCYRCGQDRLAGLHNPADALGFRHDYDAEGVMVDEPTDEDNAHMDKVAALVEVARDGLRVRS